MYDSRMDKSKAIELQKNFFQQLESSIAMWDVFEHLPQVYLFIKDTEGRFVRVNRSAQEMHGVQVETEMLGKTDFDFHPPALAIQYIEEDQQLIQTGTPLLDKVWLVPNVKDGVFNWYISSKIPLHNINSEIIGLAGVMYPYTFTGAPPANSARLTTAIEYVLSHFHESIKVSFLAELSHLSTSQFNREFHRLFHISPIHYIQQIRIGVARRQLERSETPIGTIALTCGFYDQSHFSRQFKKAMGLAPKAYRKRFVRSITMQHP